MNKVEEVAAAIRKTNETTVGLTFKELSEAMARAAIAAMENPTEGMIEACWPLYHPWKENAPPPADRPAVFDAMRKEVAAYWSAMVRRAALSEAGS